MTVIRAGRGRRRAGLVAGALLNLALLIVINVAPGWRSLPFLTGEARRVLPFVNVALVLGLLVALVLLWTGGIAVTAAGHLLVTAAVLVAAVRCWQVFPFDVADDSAPWRLIVRTVLAVFIAVEVVGLVAHATALIVRPAER